MVNMVFFQASATVIPTLLIAATLTGRLMEPWKLDVTDIKSRKGVKQAVRSFTTGIVFMYIFILLVFLGEGGALAALISGRPRLLYFILVMFAIALVIIMVTVAILRDVLNQIDAAKKGGSDRIFNVMALGVVLFVVIVGLAAIPPIQ